MKKSLLCSIVCLIFLFSLTGCSTDQPSNETLQEETTTYPTVSKPNTQGMPPKRPQFETMSEIKAFFSLTTAPNDDEKMTDNISQYASQSVAASICSAANNLVFPVSDVAQFGSAIYYKKYQCLDIIYGYNGIQYRFTYYFENDYEWNSESAPVLQNVQIGPYKADFWKKDHPNFPYEYYGFVKTNGVYLQITALGKDLSEFSLDAFDFVPLSSIGGDVVA